MIPKELDIQNIKEIYEKLMKQHENWYPIDAPIHWSFCKYFWESHVELPIIDLNAVERLIDI